jgi:flagellar hook protein FlgE
LGLSQSFAPNQWHTVVRAPTLASDPAGGASGLLEDPSSPGDFNQAVISDTITFNGDGSIGNVPPTLTNFGIGWAPGVPAIDDPTVITTNGTAAQDTDEIALDFGTQNQFDGLTQFDSNFGVNEINQNGLTFGNFTGVNVNEEGTVTAVFDNGRRKDIYQLPIAMFSNFNGLEERSGNAYLQTRESGDFLLTQSGVGGAGNVAPSSVEASTVDLAEEFTRMITTQRAYSASTKVITTSDEMLQELTQAIR